MQYFLSKKSCNVHLRKSKNIGELFTIARKIAITEADIMGGGGWRGRPGEGQSTPTVVKMKQAT